MKRDKVQELEIESTQIMGAEGPSNPNGSISDTGTPEISQSIDLSGPEMTDALAESDSIQDESVPIKIQNKIDNLSFMLSEEEDKDDSKW